jgi:CII-binding regulator of phage lambda lysogenization HflD
MSYQSNLDKLMQMALLEQLNNLVNQINKPISTNTTQHKCDSPTFLQENLQQNILEVIKVYEEHIKGKQNDLIQCSCKDYTNMFENILTKFDEHIHRFNSVIFRIENKLDELTNMVTASENRLDSIEKPDRSRGLQQKLTSFTGFVKDAVSHNSKENIVLKIEETSKIEETVCEFLKEEHLDNEEEEEDDDMDEDEENDPNEDDVEEVVIVKTEEIKTTDDQEVEEEEEVVTDDQDQEEEEVVTDDQEVEEEEVVTDDQEEEEEVVVTDDQEVEEEEVEEEVVVTDDQVEEETKADIKEDVEEEEDGEEVFEIEIDDVTYYATDEENGILYEVDKNGEVGKKVGIIKDGEPIFS